MSSPERTSSSDARRARVEDAVRGLLAEQGFRISMEAVAARVGCSKQTLYNQYGSKQELLRQVIESHLGQATGPLAQRQDDPATALMAFAEQHLNHLCDPWTVATGQLMCAEAHQFPEMAQAVFHDSCDNLTNKLAAWFARAMDKQLLRRADPQMTAELFLGMVVGLDFDRQRFKVPHRDTHLKRQRWAQFAVDNFLRAFAPVSN
ncbi:TetR/AcrR family transcriptional regulator [Pseudoxanthomonas dokdonensis]|uniref:HTH tetR-type domain-containing protein n=1 Tax=Pseudoxanthomonas dokdonensis TaxID=344882 RepID=A0A0R0CKT3_9GAMM|nr:TetR/AcrR family transcriptional regulator [Pseudoxanthomonas dokdonensis]KRG70637.1 hypothetical protein ABB29_06150 [Pseudoxanthomonas dokdonensis]